MILPTWDPNTSLSFLTSIVGMSTEMKMAKAMYLRNRTYQDHNLKIGVKRISENGRKTLMQASDHYFITQISIFLLLNNLTDSFSSALGNPLFRMSL